MSDLDYEMTGAELDETPPFDSDEQSDDDDADWEFAGELEGDDDDEGVD